MERVGVCGGGGVVTSICKALHFASQYPGGSAAM